MKTHPHLPPDAFHVLIFYAICFALGGLVWLAALAWLAEHLFN